MDPEGSAARGKRGESRPWIERSQNGSSGRSRIFASCGFCLSRRGSAGPGPRDSCASVFRSLEEFVFEEISTISLTGRPPMGSGLALRSGIEAKTSSTAKHAPASVRLTSRGTLRELSSTRHRPPNANCSWRSPRNSAIKRSCAGTERVPAWSRAASAPQSFMLFWGVAMILWSPGLEAGICGQTARARPPLPLRR